MQVMRVGLAVAVMFAALPAVAQTVYVPPKAGDGHPDLQGVWSTDSITTLERADRYKTLVIPPDQVEEGLAAERAARHQPAAAREPGEPALPLRTAGRGRCPACGHHLEAGCGKGTREPGAGERAGAGEQDAGHAARWQPGSKSGRVASRGEITAGGNGQGMAKAGSFQRMPRSRKGSNAAVTR